MHVAVTRRAEIHPRRQRPPPLAGRVQRHVTGRLEYQRRLQLRRDIARDDREARGRQVQLVAVEQKLVGGGGAGDAGKAAGNPWPKRRRKGRAGQPGQAVGGIVRLDAQADQVEVQVMDDHPVGGIARQRVAHRPVEALEKGVADGEGGGRVGLKIHFGDVGGVAGEVTDGRGAGIDQQVEPGLRKSGRGGARGGRAGQRSDRDAQGHAAGLVDARVVAADRDRQQVSRAKGSTDGGEGGRARAAAQKAAKFGREAERRAGVGVELAGKRAANGEIDDRRVEDLAERIDIVGAARKTPGGIGTGGQGVDADEPKEVSGVGVAVAECDDATDPLGGGRAGKGDERGGGEQRLRENAGIQHETDPPQGRFGRGLSGPTIAPRREQHK